MNFKTILPLFLSFLFFYIICYYANKNHNYYTVYDLLKLLLKIELSINSVYLTKDTQLSFINDNLMHIEALSEEIIRYGDEINNMVLREVPVIIRKKVREIKTPEELSNFLRQLRKYVINNEYVQNMMNKNISQCLKNKAIQLFNDSKNFTMLPLFDPKFNVREIYKQLILLNDHVSDPSRRCKDCISKHLLTIEALSDEAQCLSDNSAFYVRSLSRKCRELLVHVRTYKNIDYYKIKLFCSDSMNHIIQYS